MASGFDLAASRLAGTRRRASSICFLLGRLVGGLQEAGRNKFFQYRDLGTQASGKEMNFFRPKVNSPFQSFGIFWAYVPETPAFFRHILNIAGEAQPLWFSKP